MSVFPGTILLMDPLWESYTRQHASFSNSISLNTLKQKKKPYISNTNLFSSFSQVDNFRWLTYICFKYSGSCTTIRFMFPGRSTINSQDITPDKSNGSPKVKTDLCVFIPSLLPGLNTKYNICIAIYVELVCC